ncbi:MAG: 4-hydroxy-tetrahydrodipicolinate synthase [Bdellovibrionales bacterium]|nr:4-hydroxy-tetrahydrodipicolinate synthase [Bdellovibrionales bacterium]
MFSGTITALITPFEAGSKGTKIDFDALSSLIEWQLDCGINGFVVCGTTGESATLTTDEKLALFKHVVKNVRGRVPVIAGTGSNNTAASVELTSSAKKCGVDGVLAVTPYYNKPTQAGLIQHFSAIADVGVPTILYNIPGRVVIDISNETFNVLADHKSIVAVKEASGSAAKLLELAQTVGGRLELLSGEDHMTYFVMAAGGTGVISASSNAIPTAMCSITNAMAEGDFNQGREAQLAALPAIKALFIETNPAPAKAVLAASKRIACEDLRLPLVPVSQQNREILLDTVAVA